VRGTGHYELPDERVVECNAGSVAAVAVATLALLASANAGVCVLLSRYPQSQAYEWTTYKWRLLLERAGPVDWLILGDSSGAYGVDPALIRTRLGKTALNLCTTAPMLLAEDAWMLAEYVSRFGGPDVVLLVHTHRRYSDQQVSPQCAAHVPMAWGYWRRVSPPLHFSAQERITFLLARYVPLYSESTTLGRIVRLRRQIRLRTPFRDDGFYVCPRARPAIARGQALQRLRELPGLDPSVSDLNAQAIQEVARLAEARRFDAYVVSAPVCSCLAGEPSFVAYNEAIQGQLAQLASGSDRLHVLLSSPMTFAARSMADPSHVTHEGAQSFTSAVIAEVLADRGGGSRQIDSPASSGLE
jgi:hypothetical protein